MGWMAAATIGGSLISGLLQRRGLQEQNIAAAQQAQNMMDFQERMSSTSYQRAVKDMRAAGINPMLAYAQGGASAPAGTAAPVVSEMPNIQGIGQSALAARRLEADLENIDAEVGLKHSDTALRKDMRFTERARQRHLRSDASWKEQQEIESDYRTRHILPQELNNMSRLYDRIDHEANSAKSRAQIDQLLVDVARKEAITAQRRASMESSAPWLFNMLDVWNQAGGGRPRPGRPSYGRR